MRKSLIMGSMTRKGWSAAAILSVQGLCRVCAAAGTRVLLLAPTCLPPLHRPIFWQPISSFPFGSLNLHFFDGDLLSCHLILPTLLSSSNAVHSHFW
eukprot:c16458_g1_i1 orf=58-348(+)